MVLSLPEKSVCVTCREQTDGGKKYLELQLKPNPVSTATFVAEWLLPVPGLASYPIHDASVFTTHGSESHPFAKDGACSRTPH